MVFIKNNVPSVPDFPVPMGTETFWEWQPRVVMGNMRSRLPGAMGTANLSGTKDSRFPESTYYVGGSLLGTLRVFKKAPGKNEGEK